MERSRAEEAYQRSDALFREGRTEEALRELRALLDAYPDDHRVRFATARCLAALGRKEEATALCEGLVQEHGMERAERLLAKLTAPEPEPQPQPAPTPAPRKASKLRVVIWVALASVLIGGAAGGAWYYPRWTAQQVLDNPTPLPPRPARAKSLQAAPQVEEEVDTRDMKFGVRELTEKNLQYTEKDQPRYVRPRESWLGNVRAGVPFIFSGAYLDVPCGETPYTMDVYLPLNYDSDKEARPFLAILMPFGKSGFLKLEDWAERHGAVLFVMNDVSNATYENNANVQDAVLASAFELLRLDVRRGIALGLSGGGRSAWEMVRRYSDSFTGLVQIGFFGGDAPGTRRVAINDLPWHVLHAEINGDKDFNVPSIGRGINLFKEQGRPQKHIVFDGGHEMGTPEMREEALDWILDTLQAK